MKEDEALFEGVILLSMFIFRVFNISVVSWLTLIGADRPTPVWKRYYRLENRACRQIYGDAHAGTNGKRAEK